MAKKTKKIKIRNIVAMFAEQFNKSQTFRDKTKYRRKNKHKNKEID